MAEVSICTDIHILGFGKIPPSKWRRKAEVPHPVNA